MPLALVTGANGAIGRHVVARLRETGWRVAGLGHGPVLWNASGGIDRWIAGDVSAENLDVLVAGLGAVTAVFNLAGGSSVGASLETPLGDFERTVTATIRLLSWIHTRMPAANLVAVSSAAVCGTRHTGPIKESDQPDPLSPYGHHKLMMEQAVKYWGALFGVSAVIVRPFSVYGPGLQKQLIYELSGRLSARPDKLVLSGTGEETRDWVFVRDAARALVDLAQHASAAAPIFHLCSGEATSVAGIARLLAEAWGLTTEIEFDGKIRVGDPKYLIGSASKLNATGFRPLVALPQGLAEVVAVARIATGQA